MSSTARSPCLKADVEAWTERTEAATFARRVELGEAVRAPACLDRLQLGRAVELGEEVAAHRLRAHRHTKLRTYLEHGRGGSQARSSGSHGLPCSIYHYACHSSIRYLVEHRLHVHA